MPEIVFDCCTFSNFAFSDSLFIIKALYGRSAFITDFVSAEIWRGIQSGHAGLKRILAALDEGWLKEISVRRGKEKPLFQSLSVSLSLGEASSIAVAKIRGFLFACDDKAARREASVMAVKLTGTLGILNKAVRDNVINLKNGNLILSEMKTYGFYSPLNSLENI
jgi:predicted nucleic acid-binding protein